MNEKFQIQKKALKEIIVNADNQKKIKFHENIVSQICNSLELPILNGFLRKYPNHSNRIIENC